MRRNSAFIQAARLRHWGCTDRLPVRPLVETRRTATLTAMTSDAIAHPNVALLQPGINRQANYLEFEPIPALRAAIDSCWILWTNEPFAAPVITRSPGKGSVDLVFPLDGHFCENGERHLFGNGAVGAYLVGPLSSPAKIVSSGRCRAVGVRFRPGHGRSFLRFPIHEIKDGVLA